MNYLFGWNTENNDKTETSDNLDSWWKWTMSWFIREEPSISDVIDEFENLDVNEKNVLSQAISEQHDSPTKLNHMKRAKIPDGTRRTITKKHTAKSIESPHPQIQKHSFQSPINDSNDIPNQKKFNQGFNPMQGLNPADLKAALKKTPTK